MERCFGGEEEATHPAAAELPLNPVGIAERSLQTGLELAHGV
jgi:hypothetical protein